MALQIDPMPPAPARTDPPAVFVPKADATVAAWPTFIDQTNAVATEAESNAESASTDAATASVAALSASSSANFIGEWDTNPDGTPRTGALNVPASTAHNGSEWQLLSNIADVTAQEPGVDAVWQEIKEPEGITNSTISHFYRNR